MSDASKRLKRARIDAGYLTATEAARRLRIDYSTYAGHENGSRGFGAQAPIYARLYGVSVEWLLFGSGSPHPGQRDPLVKDIETLSPERQRELRDFLDFLKNRPD
jgi:hypothetical protein